MTFKLLTREMNELNHACHLNPSCTRGGGGGWNDPQRFFKQNSA